MEVKVLKQDGTETSRSIELKDEIFNIQPNDHAIWLDIKRIQANKRSGLASTKERNQLSGSTHKLFRQKVLVALVEAILKSFYYVVELLFSALILEIILLKLIKKYKY